jgi:predicted alpha/beta superfamily hydrolase
MKALLVGGASALIVGGCAASGHEPSPEIVALRTTAAAKVAPDFVQGGPAELMLSEQFILHSKEAGRDYLVQVCLPFPYVPTATARDMDTMFPNRDAAAVYVLDGGSDLGVFCGINRNVFTVGIAPFGFNLGELVEARERDLVHVADKNLPASGGANIFEAFIVKELKPFIETRYPVDPGKAVLTGQSLGGLFTLHVLADNPEAFWGYMICTPSVGYDPQLIDRVRETAQKTKNKRVFFGADGPAPEDRLFWDKIEAALNAPGSGLTVQTNYFPGEDHRSVGPAFASRASRWMFEPSR